MCDFNPIGRTGTMSPHFVVSAIIDDKDSNPVDAQPILRSVAVITPHQDQTWSTVTGVRLEHIMWQWSVTLETIKRKSLPSLLDHHILPVLRSTIDYHSLSMAVPTTCVLKDILHLDVTENKPMRCLGTTSKSKPCQEYLGKDVRIKARQILYEPTQLDRKVIQDHITGLVKLLVHQTKHKRNSESRMQELELTYLEKFDSFCQNQGLPMEHSDPLEEGSTEDILPQTGEDVSLSRTPILPTLAPRTQSPRNDALQAENQVSIGEFRSRSGALQSLSQGLDHPGSQSLPSCPMPPILGEQMAILNLAVLFSMLYDMFRPMGSALCGLFFSHRRTVDTRETKSGSAAWKVHILFGVRGSMADLSGVVGLFLLCLVTLHHLTFFLLGSWGFVVASMACLAWSHFMRNGLPVVDGS
ncbi:hypothetical protein N7492_003356 [Penicillium capsulatum]|uniref:Uncharacterized protein n=1 Tax=Penicillium capsulatum TaxID=69766 RepID=A0A9W9LW11_9EURO|nr:hypothetical protein N7492_003356 [Penicillium capsulatum]KAJ6122059.1 hypothetical protein N7512_004524 [Penicillium capsulatum]